jgi:hypothetical protein
LESHSARLVPLSRQPPRLPLSSFEAIPEIVRFILERPNRGAHIGGLHAHPACAERLQPPSSDDQRRHADHDENRQREHAQPRGPERYPISEKKLPDRWIGATLEPSRVSVEWPPLLQYERRSADYERGRCESAQNPRTHDDTLDTGELGVYVVFSD